jgi:hypothetical protein
METCDKEKSLMKQKLESHIIGTDTTSSKMRKHLTDLFNRPEAFIQTNWASIPRARAKHTRDKRW